MCFGGSGASGSSSIQNTLMFVAPKRTLCFDLLPLCYFCRQLTSRNGFLTGVNLSLDLDLDLLHFCFQILTISWASLFPYFAIRFIARPICVSFNSDSVGTAMQDIIGINKAPRESKQVSITGTKRELIRSFRSFL